MQIPIMIITVPIHTSEIKGFVETSSTMLAGVALSGASAGS